MVQSYSRAVVRSGSRAVLQSCSLETYITVVNQFNKGVNLINLFVARVTVELS